MSEHSHLVPNQNEMMEEYAEREEETVQATQAKTKKEGERAEEARSEIEQAVEETRNRRRGVEEARAKLRRKGKRFSLRVCLFSMKGQIAAQRLYWRKRLQQVDLSILGNS